MKYKAASCSQSIIAQPLENLKTLRLYYWGYMFVMVLSSSSLVFLFYLYIIFVIHHLTSVNSPGFWDMFLVSWDNWLQISSKGTKAGQELKNIYEVKSLNMEYLFSIICHIGMKWLAHLICYRRESTGRKTIPPTLFLWRKRHLVCDYTRVSMILKMMLCCPKQLIVSLTDSRKKENNKQASLSIPISVSRLYFEV